jgi:transposase-like protein
MNDGITISTFELFAMFPDQESARTYLEGRLWPQGTRCPVCGLGERITARKDGYYRCNACAQDFTVRTGTIMERSHIPLHHWIAAFVLVAQDPAIPVAALAKTIDVTVKTAGAVIERIYEALNSSVASHLDMDDHQFRLVDGFPAYRVGRDGSIWTRWRAGKGGRLGFAWREMSPSPSDGYRTVQLSAGRGPKTHKVSVLVCRAFHGPCPAGQECRHLDGVRTNDAAGNLAWGTPLQNQADRRLHGRAPVGEANPRAVLTDAQIAEIRGLKGAMPQKEIAAKFATTQGHISRIHRGAQRTTQEVPNV